MKNSMLPVSCLLALSLGACSTTTDGLESAAGAVGKAPDAGSTNTLELPGKDFFPESISASADGTLFVGSLGQGAIARFAPGKTSFDWFVPSGGPAKNIAGVLVDDVEKLVYACAVNLSTTPPSTIGVHAYAIAGGALKGSYPLPGGGFCNDMALNKAGDLYVADSFGRVLKLAKGAAALTVWSSDPLLAPSSPSGFGADGIVTDGNKNVYVNTFSDGRLLRIPIGADGSAGKVVELKVSPKLESPDGMRLLDASTIIVAEGAGRLTKVTLAGDTARATPIATGLDEPTSTAIVGDDFWVSEGQLGHLFGSSTGPASLPFRLRRIPAPVR
jgi:streptogramin lyase